MPGFLIGQLLSQTIEPPKRPSEIWHLRQSGKNSPGNLVVAISPNGKYLATRDRENDLFVYDLDEHQKLYEFKGHDTNWISSISFSPDSQWFVTAAGSGEKLKIWKTETGALEFEIPTTAFAAHFSAMGDHIAVLGSKQTEYYSWPGGLLIGQANWQLNKETPMTMSDDGKLVIMSRQLNQHIQQTELLNHTSKLRIELPGDASAPKRMEISRDGRWIVGCFANGHRIHLWSVADPRNVSYVLDGHRGEISALAFSSDSRFILSVDHENRFVIWDVLTRELIADFENEQSTIRALFFSPSPFRFASAGATEADSSVWIGDLRTTILTSNLPRPDSMESIWKQLGSTSAKTALRGTSLVVDNFDFFHPELREVIFDATYSNSADDLEALLAQLGNPSFSQRERATQELSDRLNNFESSLRKVLNEELPVESRYRIRRILMNRAPRSKVNVDVSRRWQRLLFALEVVDSVESRELLGRIATGHPDAEISGSAGAALERLPLSRSSKSR